METTSRASSTALEKLLALGGKNLFDKLEAEVKSGKLTRDKATKLYKAWLEHRGELNIPGFGWLKKRDIDELGLKLIDGEWCVPGHEIEVEVRDNQGRAVLEKHSAVDENVHRWIAKQRGLKQQFSFYEQTADEEVESVVRDIGII